MRFRLCNAPATFVRLMEMVLRGLTCLVYLDYIMVMGKRLEEHLTNFEEVFNRMKETNLKMPFLSERSRISGAYCFGKRDEDYRNENQGNSRLAKTKK